MKASSLTITTLKIATASGPINLDASPDKPVFVLGRNGTGKSALVHNFVMQLGGRAIYLPGSRPSFFDNESLSLTPASRKQLTGNFVSWDRSPETRWRSVSGTARNEKAIHDLTAAETQFKLDAANEIARDGKDSKAVLRLQSGESPLDHVNALLQQSNLPISCTIESAELKAKRDGKTYSIAKMSDGERAALILIAEVVAAPSDAMFVIDEPELHLHRAIVFPLISALIRQRPESTFIVSTHELELPAETPKALIAIIRSCAWNGESIASWEVDVISEAEQLPEELRVDILGSRRKVLFVEGVNSSLDRPLYALLFPNASIRPRESCRDVERAVAGLRGIQEMHHTQVFGMVDSDGMSPEQVSALQEKGIYPLPVHSVESLYYSEELLMAVATRQGETLGEVPSTLLAEARIKGLAALDVGDRMSHLASRIAERQLRDGLLQHLPDRTALLSGAAMPITVSLASPYPAELTRLQALRAASDINAIISRYPVRESGLLDGVARALRFAGRADYEKAALARVGLDPVVSEALRGKLGLLASQLR